MIQVLTATGARPQAFGLCHRWMFRQTYKGPVRWIIVDDGPTPTLVERMPDNWTIIVIRPAPFWQPGQNTQARNLMKGIDALDRNLPVVIIEDDDFYSADWLDHVVGQLAKAELVGEFRARYYSVSLRRGRQLSNTHHASLCSTAMRGKAIDTFAAACRLQTKFIDLELWRRHRSRHLFGGNRVVGIKGLPGRGGIGMGHRDDFNGQHDPAGALLLEWVGDDARFYL